MLERKTVSIPRACELVGVSRRTIYNWIAANKIQYIRTAGGSVRIFADTLWREPEPAAVPEPQAELPRVSRGA
jgi:excisionase family DNA binding protein